MRFNGEVDILTFEFFEEAIIQAVESGHRKLKLDFENLHCMNSTALGLVLATYRHLRQQGGDLRVVKISSRLQAVFDLLRISRLLQGGEDDDEDDGNGGPAGVLARR